MLCQSNFSADNPALLAKSCLLLRAGGLLVYPTETFFAIGCLANNVAAVEQIATLKKRAPTKPLPLLAASLQQVSALADISAAPQELLNTFWPGPLTVLLPAKVHLSPLLQNPEGKIAIRVTSSRLAAQLASRCGFALTASSANISGKPPALHEKDLDREFLAAMSAITDKSGILPRTDGTASPSPSTIVDIYPGRGKAVLRLLREGAISATQLQDAGFYVL